MNEVGSTKVCDWTRTRLRHIIPNVYFLAGTKIASNLRSLALVFVLCLETVSAQSIDPLPLEIHRLPVFMFFPVSAKRLCGRSQAVQDNLIVAAPKTRIQVYRAEWRKPCCDKSDLVGSQLTDANGNFDCEEFLGGEYWLAVKSCDRENVIGIDLDLRHDWKGSCETQGVVVEKNLLSWFAGRSIL